MSIYNPGRFKNGNEDRLIPIEGSIFTGVYIDRTDSGTRPEIRTSAERGFFSLPGESILIRFDVAKGNPGLGMGKK